MIQHFTGVIEQEADPRDYSVRLVRSTQYPDEAIKECSVPNSDQKVGKCVMPIGSGVYGILWGRSRRELGIRIFSHA